MIVLFDFLSPCLSLWFSFLVLPTPATVPSDTRIFWITGTWPILFQPEFFHPCLGFVFLRFCFGSKNIFSNPQLAEQANLKGWSIFSRKICRFRKDRFLIFSPFFFQGKKRVLPFMETKSILQMDGWNTRFLVGFWMDFAYFQGWTVSFTGKKSRSFSSGEYPPVEASRMLGWTEYDQKRARASGGILVGVKSFWWWSSSNDLFKGESCYLLNAFMKLVLSRVSMISGVVMGLNELCGTDAFMQLVFCFFYSLSLHKYKRVHTCFFTPSMITCWSSKVRYVSLENDFVVDGILSKNKLLSFPFGLLLSLDMFLRKKSCSNILG